MSSGLEVDVKVYEIFEDVISQNFFFKKKEKKNLGNYILKTLLIFLVLPDIFQQKSTFLTIFATWRKKFKNLNSKRICLIF